ncbi:MAG: helix-turn-helix transcriptional regulator [Flavobacteriales bacterium]
MPANKFSILRYQIIDDCLRNTLRPYPSLESLRLACEEKLFSSEGEKVSKSTIEKDLAAMRGDVDLGYFAPIAYNRIHRGYEYTEPEYTIKQFNLSEEQREAMQFAARTLVQFKDFPIFEAFHDAIQKISDRLEAAPDLRMSRNAEFIQFESAPKAKGSDLLGPILGHIRSRETIAFTYLKFGANAPAGYTLQPLLLKEHRNRWYVIGRDVDKGQIRTFGLDRIQSESLQYTGRRFNPPDDFDASAHFDQSLGVTVLDESPLELVFEVAPVLRDYLHTTPIHTSQTITESADGRIEMRLRVQQTFELFQQILGFGDEIRVIHPPELKQAIAQKLSSALKQYAQDC